MLRLLPVFATTSLYWTIYMQARWWGPFEWGRWLRLAPCTPLAAASSSCGSELKQLVLHCPAAHNAHRFLLLPTDGLLLCGTRRQDGPHAAAARRRHLPGARRLASVSSAQDVVGSILPVCNALTCKPCSAGGVVGHGLPVCNAANCEPRPQAARARSTSGCRPRRSSCCSMVNTLGIVIIIPREALQLPFGWPPQPACLPLPLVVCLPLPLAAFACAPPCQGTERAQHPPHHKRSLAACLCWPAEHPLPKPPAVCDKLFVLLRSTSSGPVFDYLLPIAHQYKSGTCPPQPPPPLQCTTSCLCRSCGGWGAPSPCCSAWVSGRGLQCLTCWGLQAQPQHSSIGVHYRACM